MALLTSELVTNAVLHAGTAASLTMCARGRVVRVEIADDSPRIPAKLRYEPSSQTGRGLNLVEQGASRWGVERRGGGKIVWFEVAL